jgi:hypothetical protein
VGEQYRSLSSSLCSFLHSPVTPSLTTLNTTHVDVQQLFFRESCSLWDKLVKYNTDGQTIDENTAHTLCMLGI